MRLSYLETIGFCKALCQATGTIVTGRLAYLGAGRYCLQQNIDICHTSDYYTAFRTDTIFVDTTTICEFTKMYAKDDTPVFNNDIIQDSAGNIYYIAWDTIKSAYVYFPLGGTSSSSNLDIADTAVIGNMLLDNIDLAQVNMEDLCQN